MGCCRLYRCNKAEVYFFLMPVLVVMIASAMHLYPFRERFLLFLVPSIVVLVSAGVEQVAESFGRELRAAALVMPGLLLFLAVLGGHKIFYEALAGLLKREISADLAVAIAALGALYIKQYFVAAEVIFIMLVGEALEDFAVGRTRSAIRKLLTLTPTTARIRRGNEETTIPIGEVTPGTLVMR